ncbi:MAG: DMT family transporter, partial [Betaproteobacteria bacterium]|nr:DMT family transporter [Betaproteobacteria bacterium]
VPTPGPYRPCAQTTTCTLARLATADQVSICERITFTKSSPNTGVERGRVCRSSKRAATSGFLRISGISAALAYMQVTALGKAGEPETRTVFYFSLGTIAVGAISLPLGKHTDWMALPWQEAAWLLPIGVLASLGQLAMTRAYRKGATLVVANMQYSGILFAALFGTLLMDEQIEPMGWAGMAVIVASGLIATYLRTRALPDTPAEAH